MRTSNSLYHAVIFRSIVKNQWLSYFLTKQARRSSDGSTAQLRGAPDFEKFSKKKEAGKSCSVARQERQAGRHVAKSMGRLCVWIRENGRLRRASGAASALYQPRTMRSPRCWYPITAAGLSLVHHARTSARGLISPSRVRNPRAELSEPCDALTHTRTHARARRSNSGASHLRARRPIYLPTYLPTHPSTCCRPRPRSPPPSEYMHIDA